MEGKDEFILTGQLGDVMKESARAGLSYIRARTRELGIDPSIFEKQTLHIHVPAGATPKDGPSAGVTMATAIASLLTGRPVRRDLAMTGEITLRGRVLPIGGLKSKLLAAHLAGVKTVLIPKRNEKDLIDIPEDVRSQLRIVGVETMDQVLAEALIDAPRPAARIKAERAARQKAHPVLRRPSRNVAAGPSVRVPPTTRRAAAPAAGAPTAVDPGPAGRRADGVQGLLRRSWAFPRRRPRLTSRRPIVASRARSIPTAIPERQVAEQKVQGGQRGACRPLRSGQAQAPI